MNYKRKLKALLILLGGLAVQLGVMIESAQAQCAMCQAAVKASQDAAAIAKALNTGVLVLLVPPVAIFCAFFVAAYKYNKTSSEDVTGETSNDKM